MGEGRQAIAGFDLDQTITQTKSGAEFAKSAEDWEFWATVVPERIRDAHAKGMRVVLFTNQAGIETGAASAGQVCSRIGQVVARLAVPVLALVATAHDLCRKPASTMWSFMERLFSPVAKVDRSASFFVGDAAGRPKGWKKGADQDHSDSDRKFARNCGVRFQTPEEYFLGEKEFKFDWSKVVDPHKFVEGERKAYKSEYHSTSQELVVLVGFPGCGKSTFCRKFLIPHEYVWVNQDTLHCADRCARECRKALSQGKSVVVDNTNPSKDHRNMYGRIAAEKKVPARIFHFDIPFDLAWHLNVFRERASSGASKRVPLIAYNAFKGQFERPSPAADKAFKEILSIPFCPSFASPRDEALFLEFQ
jgi:bifunctional polynucleotide phosphatase/kinase